MADKVKKVSRGGIWKRSGDYGDYYSVKVTIGGNEVDGKVVGGTDYFFNAYPNTYKQEGETTPDFKMFAQVPRTNTATPTTPAAKKAPVAAKKPTPRVVPAEVESPDDESIPF
jgi:hypothetical protein